MMSVFVVTCLYARCHAYSTVYEPNRAVRVFGVAVVVALLVLLWFVIAKQGARVVLPWEQISHLEVNRFLLHEGFDVLPKIEQGDV